MNSSQHFSLQKSAWFLALPLLWWGGISLTAKNQPAPPQAYEFIPVAIHAADSANYGVDQFASASMAPVSAQIIIEARKDNSISPQGAIDIVKGLTPEKKDDQTQEQQSPRIDVPTPQPTSTPDTGNNGNGNDNNGNGNGNNGNGNSDDGSQGNKQGKDGNRHDNKDKDGIVKGIKDTIGETIKLRGYEK